jgi:uncharacterized protein (DUF427 family)
VSDEKQRVKSEPAAKRIRGYLDGTLVVDTIRPLLVWEVPYYPAWYLPVEDVTPGLLVANDRVDRSPRRGPAHRFDLVVGDHRVPDAAWHHPDSPVEALHDRIRFEWDALDAWFEEDEQVHVHPRDPYKRVDVLRSSRHVVIRVDGTVVAETVRPTLLFETSLPTRFYIPKTDVRLDLLTATDTRSHCPYKGDAEWYWSPSTAPTTASWLGGTATPHGSPLPSPASSPSTTRRLTSRWTVWRRCARRPPSAEAGAARDGRHVDTSTTLR